MFGIGRPCKVFTLDEVCFFDVSSSTKSATPETARFAIETCQLRSKKDSKYHAMH